MRSSFPKDFVFGVATAAYQVEGHIENDWSDWERRGKLKHPEHRCGRAVDHWNRFDQDLALTQGVGAAAFRMSLEWARIEPEPGRFDELVIENYRHRLQRMNAMGIRPFVTLHHFTHPNWFHRTSPWHVPESVEAFRRYAAVCARILEGQDAMVVVFNEPIVILLGGYMQGVVPPGIQDPRLGMLAVANIVRSHVAARREILERSGNTPIGIAQNMMVFSPDRAWHPFDRLICKVAGHSYNHAYLEGMTAGRVRIALPGVASIDVKIDGGKDALDFVGVNYYSRAHLRFLTKPPFIDFRYKDPMQRGLTHMGWEDYPEGFGRVLDEVKRYRLPVWITENGIDDRDGTRRPQYLYNHWKEVISAVDRGIDVRGYLYWSLMDNFEWLEGWGPRFGLYHVDFETLERTPTPACEYFRQIATSGVLVPPGLGEPAPVKVPA